MKSNRIFSENIVRKTPFLASILSYTLSQPCVVEYLNF